MEGEEEDSVKRINLHIMTNNLHMVQSVSLTVLNGGVVGVHKLVLHKLDRQRGLPCKS